jgi:hypothetical protein
MHQNEFKCFIVEYKILSLVSKKLDKINQESMGTAYNDESICYKPTAVVHIGSFSQLLAVRVILPYIHPSIYPSMLPTTQVAKVDIGGGVRPCKALNTQQELYV